MSRQLRPLDLAILSVICGVILSVPSHVRAQVVQFELLREIGVELGPPEYSFGRVVGVGLTPAGEVLVLDGLAKNVRRFDLQGRYLGSFGREGAGPGEFQLPGRLRLVGDEVWISDPRLQRVTVFTATGEFIRTVQPLPSLGAIDVAVPLRGGFWLGQKLISSLASTHVAEFARAAPAQQRDLFTAWRQRNRAALVLAGPKSPAKLDTLARWDAGGIPYFTEGGRSFGGLSRTWGAGGAWNLSGDSLIVYVDAVQGSVRIWRVGNDSIQLVRSGRVPINPQPVSEAELRTLRQTEERRLNARVVLIPPTHKAQLGTPIIGSDGTVWIPRRAPDPLSTSPDITNVFLMLPHDGRPQSQVTLPDGFQLRAATKDLLIGTRRTDLDVDIVQIWRVRH